MSGRSTQLKYAAAGKCEDCGKKAPTSATRCRACLKQHNAATAALKAKLIAENRCAWCGGANASGCRTCEDCRERYNGRRRLARA